MSFYRFTCVVFVLFLAGCSSYFKRKECENTNWFEHGQKIAMSGKRLNADDFTRQCQKVEAKFNFSELDAGFKAGMAKYCHGDNVFLVGKQGERFSYDMCDGENEKKMRGRYEEGLRLFCTPVNGYRFGSSGGIYKEVCGGKREDEFLVEYRKGRKIYLAGVISEKERSVASLEQDIRNLNRSYSTLGTQKALASSQMIEERVYNASTATYTIRRVPDPNAAKHAQQLESELSSVRYQIDKKERDLKASNDELNKLRIEMNAL